MSEYEFAMNMEIGQSGQIQQQSKQVFYLRRIGNALALNRQQQRRMVPIGQ